MFSVFIGVGGCSCPISSRASRAGMASRQFIKRAPSSASAAEDMTALIIWAMVNTALLLGVSGESADMKNVPQHGCVRSFRRGRAHHCVLLTPCCSQCRLRWLPATWSRIPIIFWLFSSWLMWVQPVGL